MSGQYYSEILLHRLDMHWLSQIMDKHDITVIGQDSYTMTPEGTHFPNGVRLTFDNHTDAGTDLCVEATDLRVTLPPHIQRCFCDEHQLDEGVYYNGMFLWTPTDVNGGWTTSFDTVEGKFSPEALRNTWRMYRILRLIQVYARLRG